MDYQNAEFYKLNKNNPDLVYIFADETITYKKEEVDGKLTIVEYRKKDGKKGSVRRVVPSYEMSVEDFDIWKKKLVDDALEQRRHDDRTTRNDVSIENLLETDLVATESIADELIREEEERQAYNKKICQARELLDCLTKKQRQRYIKTMAYQKNNRTIAEEEGCSHQMISKSVSKITRDICFKIVFQ